MSKGIKKKLLTLSWIGFYLSLYLVACNAPRELIDCSDDFVWKVDKTSIGVAAFGGKRLYCLSGKVGKQKPGQCFQWSDGKTYIFRIKTLVENNPQFHLDQVPEVKKEMDKQELMLSLK